MTYPTINSTLASQNLAYFFTYANEVTKDLFGLSIVIAFFLVVFISSIMFQLRFTSRVRPETSMLASCFATLGWATILEMYSGILSPIYFVIIIGLTILSAIWVALSQN